ncbi:MAG TPA: SBBP repeat-containing protein [Acidimicrobiales bacterium]|nr:SBBP repeat-containing protein [Acidimicrobiales bacterium]
MAALRRPCNFRPAVVLALLGVVATLGFAAAPALLRRPPAPAPVTRAHDVLASLPLAFEPEAGGFVSRGPGYQLSLTAADATIGLPAGTFRLRPAGAGVNPSPTLTGRDQLPGTVNHLEGDDAAAWTVGAPTYGGVTAEQVWPGVDMVWHGNARRLEHDVVVAPGADPTAVALEVEGAHSLRIDGPTGDLVVDLAAGSARLARPVVYQDVEGTRRTVAGAFTLLGPSRIGFQVGAYDRSRPLVIDPTLVTSTALGGSGNDTGYGVAIDAAGNTYVTGSTESTDFPTGSPLQPALSAATSGPSTDVFVTKLAPGGSAVVWSTYLGGRGRDTGYSIALGPGGSVYVAGVTESPDFPKAKAAQDAYGGGPSDAFVARIAANGATLDWSTFLGGTQTDRARGVAVDTAGNAYVTGSTSSVDFPSLNAQQPGPYRPDDVDAFLTKIPASGAPIAYSTRLGGGNDDHGLAVAVDGQGEAFVTGDTLSPGFPTVRPLQAASGGSASGVAGSFPDAFVAKFAANGSSLVYSTFLGGSDYDQGTAIAVDGSGAAYLTGSTASPNFPTVSPAQPRKDADADAFVAKVDPAGAALVYSTYLGGGGADGGNGLAIDSAGDAYVTGTTGSTNWPTVKPVQAAKNGEDDAFLAKLNPTGSSLLFSTYVGGKDSDSGMSVAVDAQGSVHLLGLTASADFPQVKPLPSAKAPAAGDAFVATLSLSDTAAPSGTTATTAAGASSGHSGRVRALGLLTLALFLVAGAQTIYLRRRPSAKPGTRPHPQPAPKPAAKPAAAGAGLRVLDDDAGPPTRPVKATAGTKSTRTPKPRGGPKTGPSRPKSGPPPGRVAKPEEADDATVAVPTPPPEPVPEPEQEPEPATPRVQEPAIARLLEEDLWSPLPPAAPRPEPAPRPDAAGTAASRAASADTAAPRASADEVADAVLESRPETAVRAEAETPAPAAAPSPGPGLPLPPVPAEELSFWDLFPEDLPPARPASFPADDLLADHLALPDGPDSVAARHAPREVVAPPPAPSPPSAPPPPEAEIVIAELLDGPVPSGLRPSAESPWAPTADRDDFLIRDLLADQAQAAAAPPHGDDDDGPEPEPNGAGTSGPTSAEQRARIAADQARRRRARRGGGGRPGR